MRRSTVLSLPFQSVFPALGNDEDNKLKSWRQRVVEMRQSNRLTKDIGTNRRTDRQTIDEKANSIGNKQMDRKTN
jgi:hypothetical protein